MFQNVDVPGNVLYQSPTVVVGEPALAPETSFLPDKASDSKRVENINKIDKAIENLKQVIVINTNTINQAREKIEQTERVKTSLIELLDRDRKQIEDLSKQNLSSAERLKKVDKLNKEIENIKSSIKNSDLIISSSKKLIDDLEKMNLKNEYTMENIENLKSQI